MARKTLKYAVEDPKSRDHGKVFLLTEMPTTQGEKWAARAINALLSSGIKIPDSAVHEGLRGLASLGATMFDGFSGIHWDLLEPLMDEMMLCVRLIPDPAREDVTRPLLEIDIEEIKTRLLLRNAWLELHIGFSFAADTPISESAATELRSST